ncbi:MAG: RNA polymerase-binding protein DksA [Gammaproteobacteria bacterium]|nr:RNA polymerase-binding protein DksA [Gammaproteobacteria bacterium]
MATKTTTKTSKTTKTPAKTAAKSKVTAKAKAPSATSKVKPAKAAPSKGAVSKPKTSAAKTSASALAEKKRSRESAITGPYQFEPYKLKKNEAYMSKEQLAHFTGLLDSWGKELREGADLTVRHMKDEAAIFPDPLDRAAQEEEFTLELRTRDRERKLIKKIEESLELIETGEYGFCESCGAEIGIRRLEARPTATLCIDCKTIDEIREKQEIG